MQVRTGFPVPLFKQTPDGNATRVVKAVVKDASGADLSSSPITLSNLGDGQYSDNSLDMPSTDFLSVSYQVFENDGVTPTSDPITGELIQREIITALGKSLIGLITENRESTRSGKFTLSRGEDALIPIQFIVKELGDPYDLSDADEVQLSFRKSDNSQLLISTDPDPGTQEVTDISVRSDEGGNLDGKYFVLYDQNGSVGFWYDINNSGTQMPGSLAGVDRTVEIQSVTANDNANTVASKTQAVIDADSQFSATVDGFIVTVTDAAVGSRKDAEAGTSGFDIFVDTQGKDPISALIDVLSGTSGKLNANLREVDTNSLRLGFDQDIKAIIKKGPETSIVQLRNVLRVVE